MKGILTGFLVDASAKAVRAAATALLGYGWVTGEQATQLASAGAIVVSILVSAALNAANKK